MDQIAELRAGYVASTGRPPGTIRVGREFLNQIALECRDHVPGGVIEAAHKGELRVMGMRVEVQETPDA